jgi:hypothetical protein
MVFNYDIHRLYYQRLYDLVAALSISSDNIFDEPFWGSGHNYKTMAVDSKLHLNYSDKLGTITK